MIAATDIERMSIEERLQAIELLWDSLPAKDDALPSPAWHQDILETRRANAEAGQGKFMSIQELRKRLHEP